jgi:hypothetical protein
MPQHNHRSRRPERRIGLGFLVLLLVPLLLILHAPVLAAVVPGALITAASIDALAHRDRHELASAELVGAEDIDDLRRLAAATTIEARHHRVEQ